MVKANHALSNSAQISNARKQNIPGLIDVLIAISVTLTAPHQSEAEFVGEHSFSKSWGLRASVSFSPLPLPRHSFFFFFSPNFLDDLARTRLLRGLAKRFSYFECRHFKAFCSLHVKLG